MSAISLGSPNESSVKKTEFARREPAGQSSAMKRATVFLLICSIKIVVSGVADKSNDVEDTGRKSKADDILWDFMDSCVDSEVQSVSTCLKLKVRTFILIRINRKPIVRFVHPTFGNQN